MSSGHTVRTEIQSSGSFFFNIYSLIYLFWAALGLRCCTQAFSSCSEGGHFLIAVLRLLVAVAFLVVKQGF